MPLAPQITNTPIPDSTWYVSTDFQTDAGGIATVQTTTTFFASSAPNATAIGDIWFDTSNGNKQYRWDGSSWVVVQDTSIATANSNASTALSTATAAQASANGKNKITYSSSSPSGSGTNTGDIWWQYSGGNIIGQWAWNGSSWVSSPITNAVIANLDAGKITTGTLSSITIYSGSSGQFQVSSSGSMTATSGTIGGWTISSSHISDSGGSSTILSPATSSTSYCLTSSAAVSASAGIFGNAVPSGATYSLQTGGSAGITGDLHALGYIYNPGRATTSSAANVYMNSSTGLIALVTSSLRYKTEVNPITIPNDSILALSPKTFYDKGDVERNNNSTTGLPRILGIIAEEVAQIPVLKDLLVNYDDQQRPDSINYDRIAIAMIPLLQDLTKRVATLESK